MQIVQIPVELIDEDPQQPRVVFQEAALQELADSIQTVGLLSPIKVRPAAEGRYIIIYGNRRYLACKRLGLNVMPCVVSDETDQTVIYLEQVAENLNREGFTPVEEAEAFDKLLNAPAFSSSVKFLSSKLGKPESYIKNKLELLQFSAAVKKLVVSGTAIHNGQLTEEQLLPLKDLPLEYRDALALLTAREALAVSDVKKIARLFKDKELSATVKDRLLLKNADELIETWSAYQQSRKERQRAAEAREQAAREHAEHQQAAREHAERTASDVQVASASPQLRTSATNEVQAQHLSPTDVQAEQLLLQLHTRALAVQSWQLPASEAQVDSGMLQTLTTEQQAELRLQAADTLRRLEEERHFWQAVCENLN